MHEPRVPAVEGVEGRSVARLCRQDERHVVLRRPRGRATGRTLCGTVRHQLWEGRYHRGER